MSDYQGPRQVNLGSKKSVLHYVLQWNHKAHILKQTKNLPKFYSFSVQTLLKVITKADTSIKWTLFFGPKGVRYREMPLYNTRMILTSSISVIDKESPYYTEEN